MVPAEGAGDLFCTLQARGQGRDEYDLSSFWKEHRICSCETSAAKWNSFREYNIYIYKSGGRKSLLAASAPGIHQRLSRQLPWIGDELVSSVCVLKQARWTLILPNQEHCWHIPSVISCLVFHALQEACKQSRDDLYLAVLAGHESLSGSYSFFFFFCRIGFSWAATVLWFQ